MEAHIIGSGIHLPERVVSNDDIADRVGIRADDIFKSTGIRYRRWISSPISTSRLALIALENALDDAQLARSEIDYLLLGTMTPDRFIPGSASTLQSLAGL